MKKYQIIYTDPPWSYRDNQFSKKKGKQIDLRSVNDHYPTMTHQELLDLPVQKIADPKQCLIFMWTSSPHLDVAIELIKHWGFDWGTVAFVWDKMRLNPGYYTLSQCELCLVGKMGRIPQPRGARNIRQLVRSKRGRHSAKPKSIRNFISEMFPTQNKIEMFARRKEIGWDAWGNEVYCDVKVTKEGLL